MVFVACLLHVVLIFVLQLYACHAAAIVHHRMGWTHHEVGKVNVDHMANMLHVARECGFSVPFSRHPSHSSLAAATLTAKTPRVAYGGDAIASERSPPSERNITGGDPRSVEGAGRPWNGGAENVRPSEHVPRSFGHVADDGGQGIFLPRPGGVSVSAIGSRYGGSRGSEPSGCLALHQPLGCEGSGCEAAVGGVGGGPEEKKTSGACEYRQQGEREEEEEGEEENESRASSTTSLTSSSTTSLSSSSSYPSSNNDLGLPTAIRSSTLATGAGRGRRAAAEGATGDRPVGLVGDDSAKQQRLEKGSWQGIQAEPPTPSFGAVWDKSDNERLSSGRRANDVAFGVGASIETVQSPTGGSSEQPQQLPPASCRVVVVGAGASGLSAAACLRARGEDRVVVLERWGGHICLIQTALCDTIPNGFPTVIP